MSVKRFIAADMRRALELVRQEMGPDAIILSSQRVKQGVEILTTVDPFDGSSPSLAEKNLADLGRQDVVMGSDDAWANQRGLDQALADHGQSRVENFSSIPSLSGKTPTELAEEIERARLRMMAAKKAQSRQGEELTLGQIAQRGNPQPQAVEPAWQEELTAAETQHNANNTVAAAGQQHPSQDAGYNAAEIANSQQNRFDQLQAELADMRLLLEDQLSRISQAPRLGSALQNSLQRRIQRIGLTEPIAQHLVSLVKERRDVRGAWAELLGRFAHKIPCVAQDIVASGGVFAFVGPTGVGKTTTIAKLAARYVLARGADKVALITTDTYRMAAHDQLRTLGKILNIQVKVVEDNDDLDVALSRLKGCELVLIDTAGMRHGDPELKQRLSALQSHPQIQSLLVMSSNSQLQMLKATVHAYQFAGLAGCILTKLDETTSLGEALSVVMEHNLPVVYTTDGQDIPRDLSPARPHQLVSTAIALSKSQENGDFSSHATGINGDSNYNEKTSQPG